MKEVSLALPKRYKVAQKLQIKLSGKVLSQNTWPGAWEIAQQAKMLSGQSGWPEFWSPLPESTWKGWMQWLKSEFTAPTVLQGGMQRCRVKYTAEKARETLPQKQGGEECWLPNAVPWLPYVHGGRYAHTKSILQLIFKKHTAFILDNKCRSTEQPPRTMDFNPPSSSSPIPPLLLSPPSRLYTILNR